VALEFSLDFSVWSHAHEFRLSVTPYLEFSLAFSLEFSLEFSLSVTP